MSDPNGIASGSSAYSYPQYAGQVQPQPSQAQTPQPAQTNPQTPNASASSNANRGYPYSVNPYQYDPNSQLQSNQAYGQYNAQPQTYSQVYQQPYQYQQPPPQQAAQTQTPAQAPAADYNNAAYQNANRSYQAYGTNPYGYPNGSYLQQPMPVGQYGIPTSGSNINMANIRGPLQSSSQPPLVDPNQLPQRPKLTTTFWEDEGTVCYQVESRGISVSRREDTNFINGTKLLNVAGMTRGRRDGILKSEKVRYVVKIGAMNLKGVWIPFERALELARNEGIVDLLYPLFVKDIKELYQGPQYSGGPTAAANNNKTITPVTVTNSTYTPSSYGKDKKKTETSSTAAPATASSTTTEGADHSQLTQAPASSSTTSTTQPPSASTQQQQTTYAQYNYPPYNSYGATQGSTGAPAAGSSTDSNYKPSYYGYNTNQATQSTQKIENAGEKAPESK